jgi:hypothetical protein
MYHYKKSLNTTRKATPGMPQKPDTKTVTAFTPKEKSKYPPMKFTTIRRIIPNKQFKNSPLTTFKEPEKLFAIKKSIITTTKKYAAKSI